MTYKPLRNETLAKELPPEISCDECGRCVALQYAQSYAPQGWTSHQNDLLNPGDVLWLNEYQTHCCPACARLVRVEALLEKVEAALKERQ